VVFALHLNRDHVKAIIAGGIRRTTGPRPAPVARWLEKGSRIGLGQLGERLFELNLGERPVVP